MNKITKHTLSNGLTVLVVPRTTIPKVTVQLWYNVGSKDEKTGEKGLAHLIEHMLFKGTETLSETDIIAITNKFSGYCNAWTSYDYTAYHFDFPQNAWHVALEILADTMRNCTFKREFLASEMQAVVQELKLYNDDYETTLQEHLISNVFADHPYHYPIIGFKHDLWNMTREKLLDFYRHHYIPNNATLLIVGDVDVQEALQKAEYYFGPIASDISYQKKQFYFNRNLATTSVSIARAIEQPLSSIGFLIPGFSDKNHYLFELLSWIVASGRGSRLYKKLVLDQQLVTHIDCALGDLFDHDIFFINFEPLDAQDNEQIISLIFEELTLLARDGVSDSEIDRAIKNLQADYFSTIENSERFASALASGFLATHNEHHLDIYLDLKKTDLVSPMQEITRTYLNPFLAHTGFVVPIAQDSAKLWLQLQEESDQLDAKIVRKHQRSTSLEEAKKLHTLPSNGMQLFQFPQAAHHSLDNGLTIIAYDNPGIEKITMTLEFKAKSFYDPHGFEGIGNFVSEMLLEGTKHYPQETLAAAFESRGISVETQPGFISISMLSKDFETALELLADMVQHASFDTDALERVREQICADIREYWDEPTEFIEQLSKDVIYKNHPYQKNLLGSLKTIESITKSDISNYYKKYITPQRSTIAIVGNLAGITKSISELVASKLGAWQGPTIDDLQFPTLTVTGAQEIQYPIQRDQIVLGFVAPSISRIDPDYDALALFDHYLTGGIQGNMGSQLFQLREKTGLFYSIGGSLLLGASKQPGMVFISTLVSRESLQETEKLIKNVCDLAHETITEIDVEDAKKAIVMAMIDHFETNRQMAASFLFLHDYGFGPDYFENRIEQLKKITLDQVKNAAKKHLKTQNLTMIRIGRV